MIPYNIIKRIAFLTWFYFEYLEYSALNVKLLFQFFKERINSIENTDSFTGYLIWISTAFVMATISTAVCHVFGQEAQGAGVAEIKCILTGSRLYEYLDFRILAAKFISLIAAIGGG